MIMFVVFILSGLNSIQLLGRVGQEPVTRGENENFVTFSVATSKTYPKKNMQGETGTTTLYYILLLRSIEKVSRGHDLVLLWLGALTLVSFTYMSSNISI